MPLGAARISFLAKSQVTVVAEVIRKKTGIVAIGGTEINTTQSKFGGASSFFDATDDFLMIPAQSHLDLSGDFTLEGWFWSNSASLNKKIFDFRGVATAFGGDGSVGLGDQILFDANGDDVRWFIDGSDRIGGAGANLFTINTWHHCVLQRTGTTYECWFNGTRILNYTGGSDDYSITSFAQPIGGSVYVSPGGSFWDGYMDEIRFSSVARYTSGASITVPTEPFVNDDDTLLLLHMDGTNGSTLFEDDNGVRAPVGVSAIGNAQVDTAQSQFGGASAVFDGSGDGLFFDKSVGDFSSKLFTLECWVYPTADNSSYRQIINNSWPAAGSGRAWALTINPSDKFAFLYGYGPNQYYNFYGTTTVTTGQWYHVAVVGDGTSMELFVNGTSEATHTPSVINQGNERCMFGVGYTGSGGEFTGHIDEVRISNTARYTANFTPSTTPFVNDSNTLLLLHMDGTDGSTDFLDDNGSVLGRSRVGVSANGNAQISTAQSKFGGASFNSDGTSDYLATADLDALAFGTGDFTLEAWIYPTATTREFIISARQIASTGNPADTANVFRIENGKLEWSNGTAWATASTTVTTNTWHHAAVSRSSGTLKIFLDGVEDYSATQTVNMDENRPLHIGAIVPTSSDTFQGYIDEVRVSNTARYTAGFTPPTEPFQNDANTLLLLHMDGTDGSTTFIDDNGTF